MPNIIDSIGTTLVDTVNRIILFIPQLISGLIILAIGWVVALALRYIVKGLFNLLRLDDVLARLGLEQKSGRVWAEITSQVVFWFVFLAFLIPAFNAWQLSNITDLLNQILLYIPSIFAAVIIGFIGYILANITYNLIKNATRGAGRAADLFGQIAKYALYVFTGLIVLNQLQIASNLIQLFVAGFVAMAALAGGLAFGLGGQEVAKELLSRLTNIRLGRQTAGEVARKLPVYASEIRSQNKRRKNHAQSKMAKKTPRSL